MPISFNAKTRIFKLDAKGVSYAFRITGSGRLVHLYYGAYVNDDSLSYLENKMSASFAPFDEGEADRVYPDLAMLEYPGFDCGDYRASALQVLNADGNDSVDLRYDSFRIVKRKYAIPGQPAVYADENEAETLELVCKDAHTGLSVTLYYAVYNDLSVVTRAVRLTNGGENDLRIERAFSASVDLSRSDLDLISLYGYHQNERRLERKPLGHGNQGVSSRRGASSHFENPFIALCDHGANEDYGEVYGFSFVYSGNHEERADVDAFGNTRVLVGICPDTFSWLLKPGETFDTPECVMVYSDAGIGEMSRTFHKLYRYHLCRGPWKLKDRPVLINNWEATYFSFNGDKLLSIAEDASKLGIEMLVLDDGWFGHRDNDKNSLGDWYVYEEKLGGPLKPLVDKINALGMKFGIWFEPEMISPDSDLFRAHPDWCLHVPGRVNLQSRHQLVLDMSRKDVRDYLFDRMSAILRSANISYVKWDFNRNLSEVGSALLPPERQKEVSHRFVLGLYELLERLLKEFPDLLLEGCSGGGGRFDPAMLYYSPQFWCSDDTDAFERVFIQYGTSIVYPASTISAHVSASPSHQTGRVTSFKTRGHVAMAGAFGYELDINKCTDEEKETIKEQIVDYHKFAHIVHNGDLYRNLPPTQDGKFAAWSYVSEDKSEVLFTVICLRWEHRKVLFVRLKGLDPDKVYVDEASGRSYTGSVLMNAGLNLCERFRDGQTMQIYLKAQ